MSDFRTTCPNGTHAHYWHVDSEGVDYQIPCDMVQSINGMIKSSDAMADQLLKISDDSVKQRAALLKIVDVMSAFRKAMDDTGVQTVTRANVELFLGAILLAVKNGV